MATIESVRGNAENRRIQEELDRKAARKKRIAGVIPYLGLAFVLVFFEIVTRGVFPGMDNLQNLINQGFVLCLIAIGSSFVYAHGGLDFSVGAVFVGIAAVLYVSERGEVRNVPAMGSMNIMMDGFMGMFIALFLSKYCDTAIAVVLGSFTMKMLTNGFVAMGLSATARDIAQGFFLLILLTISANAGLLERRRADREFARECMDARLNS